IALNRFTHVAATYDGTKLSLYLDGQLAATTLYSQPINHSTAALQIGQGNGSTGNTWTGSLDEVAFYGRALTAADVSSHLASSVTASLDLSPANGASYTPLASGVPVDINGRGFYDWTPSQVTTGNTARIRATLDGMPVSDVSDGGFLVANGGTSYYVNLANDA